MYNFFYPLISLWTFGLFHFLPIIGNATMKQHTIVTTSLLKNQRMFYV